MNFIKTQKYIRILLHHTRNCYMILLVYKI